MFRNKPRLAYKGLTVILSNPSRFDKVALLSATGGSLFNEWCLRPAMNQMQCDIRLADDKSPLLDGTKSILLCGERAMHMWLPETSSNTLGEMRGSPFIRDGIVCIPTYLPQDAADIRNYESQHNPLSADYAPDASEFDDDNEEGDVKRHGKTSRKNYAFWLRSDTSKAIQVIKNGGKIPTCEWPEPIYHIYPNSEIVCQLLENTKDKWMWFDIETDYEECNMQCFAFSFDGINIYSVPILDHYYKPAYNRVYKILKALTVAIANNIVVAHNGSTFDFMVLAWKYRIPVMRCYDTMLAGHRCMPDIEKSLGHYISYFTWEQFHKDEDSHGYMSKDQMMSRLKYCAKDVRTMFLVHKAIEKHAATIPGLQHSIDTAMNCIRPYLITSLQGIRYDESKRKAISDENDQLMMQYIRICKLLLGPIGLAGAQKAVKSGKAKAFPGSNSQCCEYFHNLLHYPVVARSKKTGKPSLAKTAMFKLAMKHDNPVIQFVLAYREVAKSFGTLGFNPWKDDNDKVIPQKKDTSNLVSVT